MLGGGVGPMPPETKPTWGRSPPAGCKAAPHEIRLPPRREPGQIRGMATPCPVCKQDNPDDALYCEFCKTAFRRRIPPPLRPISSPPMAAPSTKAAPRQTVEAGAHSPGPSPGDPASPSRGLSLPLVGLVALVSAGVGFVARGFFGYSQPPPAQVAEAPSPVSPTVPPPAKPAAAPSPTEAPEPRVAAAPVATTAPAAAGVGALPNPSALASAAEPAAPGPAPAGASKDPQAPVLREIAVSYKPLEGQSQRIIIPVRLNGRVTAAMALDTGAPGTVIFTPLAERLGVLDKGSNRLMTTVGGIGGRAPAVLLVLDSLSVDEARTEFVPATVTAPITDAFEGLVGMDFLAGFSVHIDTQQHRLVLTELPASKLRPAGHDEGWWRRTFSQLEGQQTLWHQVHATLKDKISHSHVTGDGSADVLGFAERQAHEADLLASRLERYASNNAVPREWRRE
jgi:Aspartyl protease